MAEKAVEKKTMMEKVGKATVTEKLEGAGLRALHLGRVERSVLRLLRQREMEGIGLQHLPGRCIAVQLAKASLSPRKMWHT